jgi:hypothetical protein
MNQLQSFYVAALKLKKTEQKMDNRLDEGGSDELSTDVKFYLKKTEVGRSTKVSSKFGVYRFLIWSRFQLGTAR